MNNHRRTQTAQSGELGNSTAETVGRLFLSIPFSPWNGTGMTYICSGLFLKGLNPLKFLSSQTAFVSSHLFIFCLLSLIQVSGFSLTKVADMLYRERDF